MTTKRMMLMALSALGMMSGMAAVRAGDLGEAMTRVVSYADLNTDSTQGAKVLFGRITTASRSVCAPLDHGKEASSEKFNTCMDDAIASAVATVNKEKLSALYRAPNKTVLAPSMAALR